MTTRHFHRFQSVKRLAILAGATIVIGWFVAAPMAYADIGDDIGGTLTDTVGGTTDTVTDTVGGTTDTVDNTVGGTTDTVDNTVGGTTDTVRDTTGGNDGGTGGVTNTVDEGTGSTSTSTSSGGGSGSYSGSTSSSQDGGNGGSRTTSGSGPGTGSGETSTITLPDGSTIEVPVLTGGTIDGHKIFTSQTDARLSPDAAALRGMLAGFVTSGSDSPDLDRGASSGSTPANSFLEDAARAAAQAAKKLAFPMTLLVIVGIFVVGHGRIGRKDPKLILAPVDDKEDMLTFR